MAHMLESTEDHPSQSRYPWKRSSQGPTPSTGRWLRPTACPAARSFAARAESHRNRKGEGERTDHTRVRTMARDVPCSPVPGGLLLRPRGMQNDQIYGKAQLGELLTSPNAEFNVPIRPLTIMLITSTCTSLTIGCLLPWGRSWGGFMVANIYYKRLFFPPKQH